MFEKYVNWDCVAIEMLQHRAENMIALTNLMEEYASVSDGLGAVDYSKDRVDSTPDDGMINKYIQKESIKEKIQGLVKEDKQYTRAWEALTDDERRILTEFFQRGRRPAQVAVDTLCDVYGYERASIYRLRRHALDRFKRLLVG